MIQRFVDEFMAERAQLRAVFAARRPRNYREIVEAVVRLLSETSHNGALLDPERITEIDHGSHQGTLLYVVAETGYPPGTYWAVAVHYGSCSGCDTLESIRDYSRDDFPPTDQQLDQYLILALHIVQGLRQISGYGV